MSIISNILGKNRSNGESPGTGLFSRIARGTDVSAPTEGTVGTIDPSVRGFGDYANMALGGYSLIRGLFNKRPSPYKASRYTAFVRPAQGFDEATARIKGDIAGQTSAATRDVNRIAGSDLNAGLNARIGVQQNANKALSDAEFANAEAFRRDQSRVSEELNRQELINTQLDNEARRANFGVDQDLFMRRRDEALGGVSSAIQYEANRESDLKSIGAVNESYTEDKMSDNKARGFDPNYGVNRNLYTGRRRRRAG